LSLENRFVVAAQGRPAAAVLVGERATAAERRAAEEFERYVREISGTALAIRRVVAGEPLPPGDAVLIGRAETHSVVADLVGNGLVALSSTDPGLDGYVMSPVQVDDGQYLVLGGSADRSALYAVYDFLQRFAGVGYFEDGDYVPPARAVSMPWYEVRERPRFPVRQILQGCAVGYTTKWWGLEDWRREVDWAVKKRYNVVCLAMGHEAVWKDVYRAFGVDAGTGDALGDQHG